MPDDKWPNNKQVALEDVLLLEAVGEKAFSRTKRAIRKHATEQAARPERKTEAR